MAFSNELSDAQAERLAILLEELGEAQQAIGKILRHGYESFDPTGKVTGDNRFLLTKELGDVSAAIDMMCGAGDISDIAITNRAVAKLQKIKPYLHHQGCQHYKLWRTLESDCSIAWRCHDCSASFNLGARSTPSPDPPQCLNCANLETALAEARADKNRWEDHFDEACRLGGIVKTGKEDAEKVCERLREALRESEVVVDNLAGIAKRWVNAFDMYWRAWLREIGGVIVPKHHEIDGFVLRTREVYEKAKLVDRIKKILCDQLKAKSDAEKMFDAVFKFLAEDGGDKAPTN